MKNSYKTTVKGKEVTFTFLGNDTLPLFSSVTSVVAIPFTKEGKLVAVELRHRGLDLPGGHVEPSETSAEQTLRREVLEEAYMTLQAPVFIEAIHSDYYSGKSTYMLLYSAYIDELFDFIPNRESSARAIVEPSAFIERYSAGSRELMRQTIDRAWKLLQLSGSKDF